MKIFLILANVVTFLILSQGVTAAPSQSVFHGHAGRIHQHPLPVEGLSHRHGGGEPGVIARSTNAAGTISSTVVYGKKEFPTSRIKPRPPVTPTVVPAVIPAVMAAGAEAGFVGS